MTPVQLGQAYPGLFQSLLENVLQVRQHLLDSSPLEQFVAVFQVQSQAAIPLLHQAQGQVEAGLVLFRLHHLHRHARQFELAAFRQAELDVHHPEQALAPVAVQQRRQLLEGHVRVVEGRRGHFPATDQGVAERRITGEVVAHDQGVEQGADQRRQFLPLAVGDGGAQADIPVVGVFRQQPGKDGLAVYIEGGAQLPDRPLDAGTEFRWQWPAQVAAAEPALGAGRTGPVGGQVQRLWSIPEYLAPVFALVPVVLAGHPLPLPEDVIAVLDGQFRQFGATALHGRLVTGGHFLVELLRRPGIEGDVVDGEEQPVLTMTGIEEAHPQRRLFAEVEPLVELAVVLGLAPGPGIAIGHPDGLHLQRWQQVVFHPLAGLAIGIAGKAGAQDLMAIDHLAHRLV